MTGYPLSSYKGEKINVKELTLQTESYITSVSRSVWFVDNRNNTVSFIQNTIQAAFNLLKLLLQISTWQDLIGIFFSLVK